jgi:hypothetical protein
VRPLDSGSNAERGLPGHQCKRAFRLHLAQQLGPGRIECAIEPLLLLKDSRRV